MKFSAFFAVATTAILALEVKGFSTFVPKQGFTTRVAKSSPKSGLLMTAEDNPKIKEIKVGVIGCGRIGIVHLGAITKAPNVRPVIVSNPTVSKAEAGKIPFLKLETLRSKCTISFILKAIKDGLYFFFSLNSRSTQGLYILCSLWH